MSKSKESPERQPARIEIKSLSEIRPYWRNPRDNAGGVAAVAESIRQFGFLQPLVLDQQGVIIAGHTRYRALQELGYSEVPCVIADLPEQQARKYRLADNATAEQSTWNFGQLIEELKVLDGLEGMEIFFPTMDLDSLFETEIKMPTQDQIDKQADKLADTFSDRDKQRQNNVVDMVCPRCGEQFGVPVDSIVNRQKERQASG